MTTTERATCPVCQTPDLPVNQSGTLRKHACGPTASPSPTAEAAPSPGTTADADQPAGQVADVDIAAAEGGPQPVAVIEVDGKLSGAAAASLRAAVEVAPADPGRRYCKRENCGKKPHRHGWCATHHMTDCDRG